MKKIILDLCAGTGSWRAPYKADPTYEVITVEFLNGDDVRLFTPPPNVHGVLAAPPCTNLAVSGAWTWERKGPQALFDSLAVVDACMRIILIRKPTWWAMENPIGRLVNYLGKPRIYVQPHWYAGFADNPDDEAYTKKTCLWGEFNEPMKSEVEPIHGSKILSYSPSPDRWRLRSKTPEGFSRAFKSANP